MIWVPLMTRNDLYANGLRSGEQGDVIMWPATIIAIGLLGLALLRPSIWLFAVAGVANLVALSLYLT